jgi:glycosyltransferase involved in cell wall biosynthesis
MRVVYVVTRSDAIGGAHVHVHDLAVALRRAGHEAIVLSGQAGPFGAELAAHGVPHYPLRHLVRPISPWHDAAALLEIRRYLRWLRPDLVSAHSSKAGWLCRVVAATLGTPVLFTAHGWAFTTGVPALAARFYRLAERLTAGLADRIITVSEYDHQLALRYGVVAAAKLVTVHNGMPDIPAGDRARPDRLPPRLVTIARLEPQKDHGTLLRALAQLQGLAWELDVIGDGPLRSQTVALATALGIDRRVRFLGARRDIAKQLAQHQLFALISHWEGFPRSILEAMRAGLPVVASNVGGVRESVTEGETGFLVARQDVVGVRARLALLLTDPELRARLGAAGRRRYERHFTFTRMLDETLAIYATVARRPITVPSREPVVVPPRATPAPAAATTPGGPVGPAWRVPPPASAPVAERRAVTP